MDAIRTCLILIITTMLLWMPPAEARPDALLSAAMDQEPNAFIRQPPRIDRQRAASMVKKRYASDKILSVDLIESKGPPVYRVKILSPDGVVKIVFVDGRSGDLFE